MARWRADAGDEAFAGVSAAAALAGHVAGGLSFKARRRLLDRAAAR